MTTEIANETPIDYIKYVETIANLVNENVDYNGLARKCLSMRKLAYGELHRVVRRQDQTSWATGCNRAPESRQFGSYFLPTENPQRSTVRKNELDPYQLNELGPYQLSLGDKCLLREDQVFVALLDAASTTVNPVTWAANRCLRAFADTRVQVEQHRLVGTRMIVRRDEVQDWTAVMHGLFDRCNDREFNRAGFHGSVLGCQLLSSYNEKVEVIPPDTAYIITDPAHLGSFGLRSEYRVDQFIDKTMDGRFPSLAATGYWSMCIPNCKAVAKLVIT